MGRIGGGGGGSKFYGKVLEVGIEKNMGKKTIHIMINEIFSKCEMILLQSIFLPNVTD